MCVLYWYVIGRKHNLPNEEVPIGWGHLSGEGSHQWPALLAAGGWAPGPDLAGWGSSQKALIMETWPPCSSHREDSLSLSSDSCSSHNTAMAVAALGGFLYVLAEYPPASGELRQSTPAPPTATATNVSTPATGR